MIRSAISPKPKLRSCKVCKEKFEKQRMGQVVCGPKCAAELAMMAREKQAKAEYKARKEAVKTRSDWLKEAQQAFNSYVRARDEHLPCVSCGRFHTGAYDAGHYRSVGSMPALRFNEDNCHKQCVPCNQHKAGNVVEYRIRLVERIGADRVAVLEGPHEAKKYGIDEIKAIKAHYKAKLKELQGAK
jgi:hypothetical protein